MFERIKNDRMYAQIVEQICRLIKEDTLKPGDKLPSERLLIEKLGVSRPSVREALAVLDILGIVETKGGKGNFIADRANLSSYKKRLKELSIEESSFELLQARELIEPEIAGLAAENATPKDIKVIQQSLEQEAKGAKRVIEFSAELDRSLDFHLNVARATHNKILVETARYLINSLRGRLWMKLRESFWKEGNRPQTYFKEHTHILEAIEKKNKESARERMCQHLKGAEKEMFGD